MIIEIPKQRNVTILPQFAIVDMSSYHPARINVSRNAFLNSRSEEKNISLTFIPGKKQIKMWFCGLYSYRRWIRFITLFPNNVFLLLLRVEWVCKSFWKESWRVQVAHLHNAALALSSRSRCFQLSTNLKVAEHSFSARFCWCKLARAQGFQKNQHAVNRAIILFTQHLHYLCYFSL